MSIAATERRMSMDTPTAGAESQDQGAATGGTGAGAWSAIAVGWKARESLWLGLIVLLLGVIGQILLYVVPSEDFATNSGYADYQMIGSLRVVAEAAMYLGAVWVGVYLARWGVARKKD